MALTDKQKGVLRGILVGIVLTVLGLAAGALWMRPTLPFGAQAEARLVFALRWDLLLAACLAVSTGMLARHRFFTPEDIDGGGLTTGSARAQVLQSTLQNTLEQTVLGVCAHLMWAATMPPAALGAIPAAALLFLVGRVLFVRGYAAGAPARALGFALTFYPSVAMLLVIAATLAGNVIGG